MEAERKMEEQDEISGIDVDFSVTESGRTTIRGTGEDDDTLDMDFSLLASARTLGNTERSMATIGTIDTNYTEGSIDESVSSSILDSRRSVEKMDSGADSSKSTSSNPRRTIRESRHFAPKNSRSECKPRLFMFSLPFFIRDVSCAHEDR